ncbi:MAG: metal ABC transporter substrate-binding protein [Chloroflexia bacterium]
MFQSKTWLVWMRILRGAAVVLVVLLAACGTDPDVRTQTPGGSGEKLLVVATTTQIRSITEAVAGDRATVRSILTPGVDAHEFEPKPSDVEAISKSGLVLKNGVGLDDWVDKLIESAGSDIPVVTVTGGVALREGGEEHEGADPHVWFSVANAMTMTVNIRDALVKVDGANASAYAGNAERYLKELQQLDEYILAQVGSVPQEQRKMVTNHDAYGYFIERYGLTFVGSIIPSMSTDAQPSAQDVAELVKKIEDEGVRAIFLESSINPSLAKQIGQDAGVKVIDTLYGDTLGEAGSPGETYVGMMRYNTDTIVAALK